MLSLEGERTVDYSSFGDFSLYDSIMKLWLTFISSYNYLNGAIDPAIDIFSESLSAISIKFGTYSTGLVLIK